MKSKFILLATILVLLLSACEITPTPTPAPDSSTGSEQAPANDPAPQPTATFTPEPEESTETESGPESSEAETSEETEDVEEHCITLLEPLDLADLPAQGKVVFTWTAHPDAETYSLNFIFPDGLELNFTTDETTLNRYMDGFSMHPAYNQSGEHQWNVSALNTAGEELCQSDFFTFTKPLSDGASEENSNNGGNGDGDACGGPGCDPGEPGTE
jgi:hypothetical protein